MFPLPIGFYVKAGLVALFLFGSGFIGYRIGHNGLVEYQAAELKQKAEWEQKVANQQAQQTQKAQNEKDALETHYQLLLSQYRSIGLHSHTTSGSTATLAVPNEEFRLSGSNVEFLINFAKQCSATEIERNDVIEKYNDLR